MAVMDEFREEREALKNADFKTKFLYFLDYYKWHVIVIVCVIGFVISYIHGIVTAKDPALSGYLVNFFSDLLIETEHDTDISADFAEYAGIDTEVYDVLIDSTLQINTESLDESTIASTQKLTVMMAAGEMDFLACNEDVFLSYATPDYLYDLRDIYTEEELARYEDYIYYVDMEVIRAKEEIMDSYDATAIENYQEAEYDHFAPEEMKEPIPIAICIEDSPVLQEHFYYYKGAIPLGFAVTSTRVDNAKIFVEYLFQDLLSE